MGVFLSGADGRQIVCKGEISGGLQSFHQLPQLMYQYGGKTSDLQCFDRIIGILIFTMQDINLHFQL